MVRTGLADREPDSRSNLSRMFLTGAVAKVAEHGGRRFCDNFEVIQPTMVPRKALVAGTSSPGGSCLAGA